MTGIVPHIYTFYINFYLLSNHHYSNVANVIAYGYGVKLQISHVTITILNGHNKKQRGLMFIFSVIHFILLLRTHLHLVIPAVRQLP